MTDEVPNSNIILISIWWKFSFWFIVIILDVIYKTRQKPQNPKKNNKFNVLEYIILWRKARPKENFHYFLFDGGDQNFYYHSM